MPATPITLRLTVEEATALADVVALGVTMFGHAAEDTAHDQGGIAARRVACFERLKKALDEQIEAAGD
jgi:hypothetical protein